MTPTGFFVVMPQMRRLSSKEAAHFQGFGPSELDELGCSDDITEKDLLDLVGNAFSTTVVAAVILASVLAWRRE